MRSVTAAACPALAGIVDGYMGYRFTGFPGGLHRGLPSTSLTLIVSIGPPIDVVAQTNRAQAPRRYRTVVGGLQASAALIAHDGFGEGVQIAVTPIGARALFGMPAGAMWDLSLELDEVIGPIGNELWERLQEVADWRGRFCAIDDVLGRVAGDRRVAPVLARSWSEIAGGEFRSVDEVAARIGWSRQHFAKRFATEYGLAPKLAARIARFDRARRTLFAGGAGSLAELAVRCGYFDQSHLNRDFAEFAGCPPARLLQEEDLPLFQDGELVET